MPPEKILKTLEEVLEAGERPLVTLKTAWKPRFGTPTLWLSVTNSRLLLFSTLRARQIYRGAKFCEINSIVAEHNGRLIKVLFWDSETPDLAFQIDPSVPQNQITDLIQEVNSRLSQIASTPRNI